MSPGEFVAVVEATLQTHRNPEKAVPMAKYMKNWFPFLGLPRPAYEVLVKPIATQVKGRVDEKWLEQACLSLWQLPEREFQYVALTLLKGNLEALTPTSLPLMQQLVQRKSWWDTVDTIASHPVGSLISRFPALKTEMDVWNHHPNLWVRRTSLLHQLGYKAHTDAQRLFRYCLDNATDQEFFIRKAIGWALREYAKTNPQAVYNFVDNHRDHLSPLSIREALKHRE